MSTHSPRNLQQHMSISALLSPDNDTPDVFRAVVQKHFERTLDSMPPCRNPSKDGLLTHIGETVLHLQGMVADIAEELVYDNYHSQVSGTNLYDGFVEGGNLDDLRAGATPFRTHTALGNVIVSLRDSIKTTKTALESTSKANPHHHQRQQQQQLPPASMPSSHAEQVFSPRSSASASNRTDSFSGSRPGNPSIISDMSPPGPLTYSANPSPESMESPASPAVKLEGPVYDTDMELDRQSLNSRGKSFYVCKYGKSCTKGGVDRNGNMIEFVRNCMIRQHMDKHDKPFRCRIAGCPNKEGFARRDQLERHEKNVKHDVV